MKALIRLTVFLVAGGFCSAGEPAPKVSAQDVSMARLDLDLPVETQAAAKVLWDKFANKPEETKFAVVTIREWRELYPACVDQLVHWVKNAKLGSDSLRRILKKLDDKRGSLALLPVGAYAAKLGGRDVWIIVCKWEIEAGSAMEVRLGHVRIFAHDVGTLEQVAVKTCM